MIKLIKTLKVTPTERQFEVNINGKIIQFAKWVDYDFSTDYEILKKAENLTEGENDELIDFIEEQEI